MAFGDVLCTIDIKYTPIGVKRKEQQIQATMNSKNKNTLKTKDSVSGALICNEFNNFLDAQLYGKIENPKSVFNFGFTPTEDMNNTVSPGYVTLYCDKGMLREELIKKIIKEKQDNRTGLNDASISLSFQHPTDDKELAEWVSGLKEGSTIKQNFHNKNFSTGFVVVKDYMSKIPFSAGTWERAVEKILAGQEGIKEIYVFTPGEVNNRNELRNRGIYVVPTDDGTIRKLQSSIADNTNIINQDYIFMGDDWREKVSINKEDFTELMIGGDIVNADFEKNPYGMKEQNQNNFNARSLALSQIPEFLRTVKEIMDLNWKKIPIYSAEYTQDKINFNI